MKQAPVGKGMRLLLREDLAEAADWRNYLHDPSPSTRMILFNRYLSFARQVSCGEWHRIGRIGLEQGDASQIASEALLQAIDRFDPSKGVPFTAYSRLRIRGAIHNELARATEAASVYNACRRKERARLQSLKDEVGTTPGDPLDLLREMAIGIAIGFILEAGSSAEVPMMSGADHTAYDMLAWQQLCDELGSRMSELPERERLILHYHYRQDVQFQEIATLLGVSKGRVSQLHAQALQRMRRSLSRHR